MLKDDDVPRAENVIIRKPSAQLVTQPDYSIQLRKGTPLISLISVCPRWPFCGDEKVLLYTMHEGRVIFYWYRKVQPCSLQYHASGPCENGESKGFEILARAIESGKSDLQIRGNRLVWNDKYLYAFSLQGIQMQKFAFSGRIYFQTEPKGKAYYSQPVSASMNGFAASGPARREDRIIPGARLVERNGPPSSFLWALGVLGVGLTIAVLL